MYSPAYNRVENRAELVEFMRANSFALLVTAASSLCASHLPVRLREESGAIVLEMHMAKSNEQWKAFSGEEAMVVFSGPHAYVSPRWYEAKERVPTWNYAAVHAYGVPTIVDDPQAKHASQRRLVAEMDPAWLPAFDALRPKYLSAMLEAIVVFEVPVARLEARWKLSQNRGRREQELIAQELEKSGDSLARALAALTRKHLVED